MCAARIVEGDQGEATTYYQLLQLPSPTLHTCTLLAPCTLELGACKGEATTHYQLLLPSPTRHTCTLLTPPSPFTLMLRLLHFCIIRQLFQIQAAPGQVRGKFKDHIQHQIQSGMYAYIGIPI